MKIIISCRPKLMRGSRGALMKWINARHNVQQHRCTPMWRHILMPGVNRETYND